MKRARIAKSCVVASILASASLVASGARAQVTSWPADEDWTPLAADGVPIGDPQGDTNPGSIDVVGDADNPAFFVNRDADNLYFRIRVDADPIQGASFRKFGWGCEIDTDGDLTSYEFIAMLDGISSGGAAVTWLRNAEPETTGTPNDKAERPLATEDAATYARAVSAGTVFPTDDPDEDFFVDFAISLDSIASTPLVDPQLPEDVLDVDQSLIFVCGTSANTATLNKDYGGPGSTLEELGSDPVTCTENGCTACNTAAACGESCTACDGADICDPTTLACTAPCGDDGDCSDTTRPLCATDSGVCVECLSDDDCTEGGTCNTDLNVCEGPDSDGDGVDDDDEEAAGTDPEDGDSDDDGVPDGVEVDWDGDSDGDGLINALDPDADNDGLFDGTEMGFGCDGADTDAESANCVADGDGGVTTTSPVDADTDDGGVPDGAEDFNGDGVVDDGELDPNLADDDADATDSDGDSLPDDYEDAIGSDPESGDSDGDGLPDELEQNPTDDTDGDGEINILDPDSDGDGLFDGTEAGRDCSSVEDGASTDNCIADEDGGETTTSVLIPDTDGGGVSDGDEDENKNGIVDDGESDPNDTADDDAVTGAGGGGGMDAGGGPGMGAAAGETGTGGSASGGTGPTDLDQELEGGGCACTVPQSSSERGLWLGLGLLLASLVRRRRRVTSS
jgi:MYXO-CTERM domain-containing protein